jgi:hypothetical protein
MVVDLLLTVTYAKTFGHKPTLGNARPLRGSGKYAYFLAELPAPVALLMNGGWHPPFDGVETVYDDRPDGISVVHFSLTDAAERDSGQG